MEIILESRKKRILYELCYLFFNPINFKIFHPIKQPNLEFKDEEINACYGYLILLMNLICNYLQINQRYMMFFKGSRSLIKKNNELLNAFMSRSYNKMEPAIVCLIKNFGEIFNYLKIDKKFKENNLRSALEIVCNFLYYGEFREMD